APLADLGDLRFAQVEAGRRDEPPPSCLELRVDRDLSAGHHAELVRGLGALGFPDPHREPLPAPLMLALYPSGPPAGALQAYQMARATLVEELGLEPGRELRDLHHGILRQDPELDQSTRRETGRVAEPTAQKTAAPARKTVTAVFCDLADSTALAQRLDPEA